MKRKDMLGFLIKTLDNLFFRNMFAYETRQRGVDEVTVMHGWILGFLFENDNKDIFQKDIEVEFSIAKSTVTSIVKLMEKKGYIFRESVEKDGRLKKLALTERGRRIHERHMGDMDILEERCRRNITPEEFKVFLTVAEKLKQNLEEDIANSISQSNDLAMKPEE
ncbi:hypothetical protein C806_03361 [Lachnospiraceae bacterium 3-1]|nr:hypothetical protein C806_03361 [Lachnospiraceae bacterium 3-1]